MASKYSRARVLKTWLINGKSQTIDLTIRLIEFKRTFKVLQSDRLDDQEDL